MSAAPVFDPTARLADKFGHHTRLNGHATVTGGTRFRNSAVGDFSPFFAEGGFIQPYGGPGPSSESHDVCKWPAGGRPSAEVAVVAPLPYTRSVTNYSDSQKGTFLSPAVASVSHLPTPNSTPSSQRKNYRRISSMFSVSLARVVESVRRGRSRRPSPVTWRRPSGRAA